jgi:mycothiol synthase
MRGADPAPRGSPLDTTRYSIRPFVRADFVAQARLDDLHDPGFAPSAEEHEHWEAAEAVRPGHFKKKFAVDDRRSGAFVAYAELTHTSFNYHPHKYWIGAYVDPTFQGQGIGTELYTLLEREAVDRGAIGLWTDVREGDAPAERFYARHGFATLRRTWRSRLDVARANLSAFPDRSAEWAKQGIRLTTLAAEGIERPEVRHRLYRLSDAASADVPRVGEYSPISFEQFVQIDLEAPGVVPEAYFLAAHGEQYVGMTILSREQPRPDSLHVGFTGTHPDFRGRGIASELKRRAVEYARDHGVRYLVTNNDSLNRPIWAINQKLGFQPMVTWLLGEKSLGAPRTP